MLIDSHCHLDAPEFDVDRAAVIADAVRHRVNAQILPAVTAAGWPRLHTICQQAPGLFPAYGLHPMYLSQHRPADLPLLRQWLQDGDAVAVGECGLDFFVEGLEPGLQHEFFQAQLTLAREFDLPVIIHARRAVDAVIAAIRRTGPLRGVVHSFSGSPEQARQLWDLGFLIGLGGPVTYERAQRLRRLATDMPLEFLLLETDAPDQPDAGIRGQRNTPARLPVVAQAIADLRGIPLAELAHSTSDNARRLFKLPLLAMPSA